jgi:hypothetical protein
MIVPAGHILLFVFSIFPEAQTSGHFLIRIAPEFSARLFPGKLPRTLSSITRRMVLERQKDNYPARQQSRRNVARIYSEVRGEDAELWRDRLNEEVAEIEQEALADAALRALAVQRHSEDKQKQKSVLPRGDS